MELLEFPILTYNGMIEVDDFDRSKDFNVEYFILDVSPFISNSFIMDFSFSIRALITEALITSRFIDDISTNNNFDNFLNDLFTLSDFISDLLIDDNDLEISIDNIKYTINENKHDLIKIRKDLIENLKINNVFHKTYTGLSPNHKPFEPFNVYFRILTVKE